MNSDRTTTSARITERGGLLYNRALKRCVDQGVPGARCAHTLFEYGRVTDETYRPVLRVAVPRWYAMRWLAGESIGRLESERACRRQARRRARMTPEQRRLDDLRRIRDHAEHELRLAGAA